MSAIKEMPLWKWILLFLASLVLAALLYGFGMVPVGLFGGIPLWVLVLLVGPGMLWLYSLVVRWFEKDRPKDLPLRQCVKHTGLGLAVGLGFFMVVVGVMMLAGAYRVVDFGNSVISILNAFSMFLIVAIGEEVMFRGVLFRWIDERWGFWWAIGISALVFGLVHITNNNATLWASIAIALEAGVLLGAAYKWAGTLWFPIGIHWAWNFAQGNIFGFAVSGEEAGDSILQAAVSGPDWLTGGAFGAEASVIAAVAGTALGCWFIWKIVKKKSYGHL